VLQKRVRIAPEIDVSELCLGGNVFGWTADEKTSRNLLDAYVGSGGNFVDTSDSYSFWAEGNQGGESETIIGRSLAGRTDRASLVIATKVSHHPDNRGMARATIRAAVEQSLRRLGLDEVDLYYAHVDDPYTPLAESAEAMSSLVDQGKVRAVALSNYTPERIDEWRRLCDDNGWHRPVALQPQYSLMERGIENDVLPLARNRGLAVFPYYSLARGFLTGKYTSDSSVDSARASSASKYLHDRGRRVLEVLEGVATTRQSDVATVALAWLLAQDGVVATIASARTPEQLVPLLAVGNLRLAPDDVARLGAASESSRGERQS
jgi:aryl-alcohol dehydrogenase-like predicted oxidoreductase